MSDEQLNAGKKKERVFVLPATMNKYSMNLNQLLELRAGYEARIKEVGEWIAENPELTATKAMWGVLIGEAEFQIRMIDKILASS